MICNNIDNLQHNGLHLLKLSKDSSLQKDLAFTRREKRKKSLFVTEIT